MVRMQHLTVGMSLTLAVLAFGIHPASAQTEAAAEAREANLRAYAQLLRSDLRAEKVGVITEVMEFTPAEDEKFWPISAQVSVSRPYSTPQGLKRVIVWLTES